MLGLCNLASIFHFLDEYGLVSYSWGSRGKGTGVVCHLPLQWTTFCPNSSLWPIYLGWPCVAQLIASLSYASPFTSTRLWSRKARGPQEQKLYVFTSFISSVVNLIISVANYYKHWTPAKLKCQERSCLIAISRIFFPKDYVFPTSRVEGKTNTETVITEFPILIRSSKFKELWYHFLGKRENGTLLK